MYHMHHIHFITYVPTYLRTYAYRDAVTMSLSLHGSKHRRTAECWAVEAEYYRVMAQYHHALVINKRAAAVFAGTYNTEAGAETGSHGNGGVPGSHTNIAKGLLLQADVMHSLGVLDTAYSLGTFTFYIYIYFTFV